MKMPAYLLVALAALVLAAPARAEPAAPADRAKTWQAMLARPSLAVAVAFDARGRLWQVSVQDGHLLARHSDTPENPGAAWSTPLRINPEPEAILGDGENRPKLIARRIGGNDALFVSWTRGLAEPMSGDIRFSRSLDGGKSFSAPATINDNRDVISHRFDALVADDEGRVALAWLDKRDLHAAQQAGRGYAGAAVYVAESHDGGQTFAANRKLTDHSCECCRIALAQDRDGTPVAFWRHVFGGENNRQIRDFALARFDAVIPAIPPRATRDDWQLDGCPHHGGALAIDAQGSRHLAWFTGATGKAGLYYRRSDVARSAPERAALAFGDPERQPGHPTLHVDGESVVLAWQEYDGKTLRIRTMHSHDRGVHWSQPQTPATTAHAADRPQLLAGRGKTWLAWNTADEGLRLWALHAPNVPSAPDTFDASPAP